MQFGEAVPPRAAGEGFCSPSPRKIRPRVEHLHLQPTAAKIRGRTKHHLSPSARKNRLCVEHLHLQVLLGPYFYSACSMASLTIGVG
ncbi:unnamed protein product [Urochloa humidicola]